MTKKSFLATLNLPGTTNNSVIHDNDPGILVNINHMLEANGINIVGQYLKTNEQIGYVITDINKEYDKEVIKELRAIPNTIKFRVLY